MTPPSEQLDLEALIARDPDEDAPTLVYADWLERRGDPRGRWISLHHAYRVSPSAEIGLELEDLERAHQAALIPALERVPEAPALGFHNGFVRAARIFKTRPDGSPERDLARLLGHPAARFLRGLIISRTPKATTPDDPTVEHVWAEAVLEGLSAAPETLDSLFIGERIPERYSWTRDRMRLRNGARIWELLPGLRSLVLDVTELDLGPVVAPRLARLELRHDSLNEGSARSLSEATLPELRALALPMNSRGLALVDALQAPRLEDLSLSGEGRPILLHELEALLQWPGFSRLRRLELDDPTANDGSFDGHFLRRFDERFSHLEEVRLVPTRFGAFSALEGVHPYKVLHPLLEHRRGDALETFR